MENQHMILSTGNRLLTLLQETLKQEFGIAPEQVGMGVPGENSSLALCVYLYDIKKNTDMQLQERLAIGLNELQNPSSYYDLYYMLVPYSNSDWQYKMQEEIKLVDVLIRWIGDIHYLDFAGMEIAIELYDIDMDEKIKIWGGLNQPFHMALYCKVGPVEVQSAIRKEIRRVKEVQMHYVRN